MKIGPANPEIIFLKSLFWRKKRAVVHILKSQSYWTKIHQNYVNVARSLQMSILKSAVRYSKLFWNAKATNRGEYRPILPILPKNWLPWQRPLSGRQKKARCLIICPIAIAYSMGQIIKSFCVCPCVCVSVRLWTLSRSHFFVDFHQIGHRRVNPQK